MAAFSMVFLLVSLLLPLSMGAMDDTLASAGSMRAGDRLVAGDRLHRLEMQSDCNLVLYNSHGRATWASNTGGQGSNCEASLQDDGNLVIYTNGRPLWASNTNRDYGDYFLKMQNDGNAVIYKGTATWATNTAGQLNGMDNNGKAPEPEVLASVVNA